MSKQLTTKQLEFQSRDWVDIGFDSSADHSKWTQYMFQSRDWVDIGFDLHFSFDSVSTASFQSRDWVDIGFDRLLALSHRAARNGGRFPTCVAEAGNKR